MIAHTIPQAAERVGRSADTIRQWIRDGHLIAVRNDIDGQRYVSDDQLLEVERAHRTGRHALPPGDADRQDARTAVELVEWLRDRHGIDLGPPGAALIQKWSVRYSVEIERGPSAPYGTNTYRSAGVLAVARRLATRRHAA